MSPSRFTAGLLLALLAGCHAATPAPRGEPMTAEASDADVEMHLTLALSPHGNRADLAQREESAQWLLEHANRAYPAALAKAKEAATPRLVDVLGRFRRPESTGLLAAALSEAGPSSRAAGLALGASPDPGAKDALVKALGHADPEAVAAAVDGLRVRADRSVCPELLPVLRHPSNEVRYLCVNAGAALGCLDAAALRAVASGDADPEVRKLAAELAAKAR